MDVKSRQIVKKTLEGKEPEMAEVERSTYIIVEASDKDTTVYKTIRKVNQEGGHLYIVFGRKNRQIEFLGYAVLEDKVRRGVVIDKINESVY